MNGVRTEKFKRNAGLEALLDELSVLLSPAENKILKHYASPQYPVILIVGAPRSGTTLMLQWLAQTGKFAYPTNLLSRFYAAPYIGVKIQLLLTDPTYRFRDEFIDFSKTFSFDSDLGKTRGILAPNEFWYFWRRFFPYGEIQHLDEQGLTKVDAVTFLAELAAIESALGKPLALKGMIINWNIPYVENIFNKVLFVYLKRHPFYNMQSLLAARNAYWGDPSVWYSFKPMEYTELKDLGPHEQVAGQIFFTNRAIEKGLAQISADRLLAVDYEMFCASPEAVFSRLADTMALQNFQIDRNYSGPKQFRKTNQIRLPDKDCQKIIDAYRHFSGEELQL